MENKQLLDSLYNDVKALGLASDQFDFSVMCGRSPAWFSAIKARNLPLTTDATLTLSYNIRHKAEAIADADTQSGAMRLSDLLIEQAQQQIGRKLARSSGCSFA